MITVENLNIEEIIRNSTLDELFGMDFNLEEWIWINKDIFADLVFNVMDYDLIDEDYLYNEINDIKETAIVEILEEKFKEIGWILIDQRIFSSFIEDFNSTEDINTYIYIKRKFYSKKIIEKSNELDWILKSMAVDTQQYLDLSSSTVVEVYDEYFKENPMIIEKILTSGEHDFNQLSWKLYSEGSLLVLYNRGKEHRTWLEGNANFIFSELTK